MAHQGQHVTIDTGAERFKAIVLEVRGNEVLAQETGTQRAEWFHISQVR